MKFLKRNKEKNVIDRIRSLYSLILRHPFISILVLVATCILLSLASVVVIHVTPIRYELEKDPLGKIIETQKIKRAKTDVDKANAYLDASETRFNTFKALHERPVNDPYKTETIQQMLLMNQSAIDYMDNAKQAGEDIKKLNLVKRLCDLLGQQMDELTNDSNIAQQHNFAEQVEDRVAGGQEVDAAIKQVQADIDGAMRW
jgi:hypothetical protein